MSGKVWISSMHSNYLLGDKPGIRAKFFGKDWAPARHELDPPGHEFLSIIRRCAEGLGVERSKMPEAAAVWDKKAFARTHDLFAVAGFYVLRGKLAEVFSRFDLGEGGGLIPFTIYEADLETPYPGEYWLLDYRGRKNTILPEQSENVVKFAVDHKTGQQIWKINGWHEDGDVVLSAAALDGPNIWYEEAVYGKIFMSSTLVRALQEAELAGDWQLKECQIEGDAA